MDDFTRWFPIFFYLTVEERDGGEIIPPSTLIEVMGSVFLFSVARVRERGDAAIHFSRKTKNKQTQHLSLYFFFLRPHFAGKSRTGQRRIELLSLHYVFALHCQSRVESTPAPHTHTHTYTYDHPVGSTSTIISCAVHQI
jgi:hypothetical protein